jgi:hypothetical protein
MIPRGPINEGYDWYASLTNMLSRSELLAVLARYKADDNSAPWLSTAKLSKYRKKVIDLVSPWIRASAWDA